jgi:hypothetical protein
MRFAVFGGVVVMAAVGRLLHWFSLFVCLWKPTTHFPYSGTKIWLLAIACGSDDILGRTLAVTNAAPYRQLIIGPIFRLLLPYGEAD